MTKRRWYWFTAAAIVATSLVVAGIAGAGVRSAAKPAATKVTVQLKWVTQAQFAGYYAAKAKGFYAAAGLDVTIRPGGPDITPEQVVASGQAEFGLNRLPSLLATREKGGKIVNIAQVFTRSGMTELTWKDSGITSVAKLRGKKVGVWCCGNELELFAALVKNGIDPKKSSDVTIVNQPIDMNLFLQRKIDAAAAMTYNELAQVLEVKNPKTGKLYQLSDLNVITMESAGTAMLEDGIFTREDWLKSPANQATAVKFLAATFAGWIWCRDNAKECTEIVLKNGPTLGRGHQVWQMNEINALIWPAPKGLGIMDPASFNRTAKISQQFGVITKAPSGAYRTDLAKKAVAAIKAQGLDPTGKGWKKATVKVTAGGK